MEENKQNMKSQQIYAQTYAILMSICGIMIDKRSHQMHPEIRFIHVATAIHNVEIDKAKAFAVNNFVVKRCPYEENVKRIHTHTVQGSFVSCPN